MAQGSDKSLPALVSELWQLVVAYLKQETVEPLKNLGRFVGLGIGGAVCLGIGLVLLVLAGLRALQIETAPHLTGSLTWVPYVVVLVVTLAFAGLSARAITSVKRKGAR